MWREACELGVVVHGHARVPVLLGPLRTMRDQQGRDVARARACKQLHDVAIERRDGEVVLVRVVAVDDLGESGFVFAVALGVGRDPGLGCRHLQQLPLAPVAEGVFLHAVQPVSAHVARDQGAGIVDVVQVRSAVCLQYAARAEEAWPHQFAGLDQIGVVDQRCTGGTGVVAGGDAVGKTRDELPGLDQAEVLWRALVVVQIEESGQYGLAVQVQAMCACRHLQRAGCSNRRDAVALDQDVG